MFHDSYLCYASRKFVNKAMSNKEDVQVIYHVIQICHVKSFKNDIASILQYNIKYQFDIAEILEVSVEYANVHKVKGFDWIEKLRCRPCKKSKKVKKKQ